jgi:hypothetical protein
MAVLSEHLRGLGSDAHGTPEVEVPGTGRERRISTLLTQTGGRKLAEAVAAGGTPLSPMPGMSGEPVPGADFGHFSILVSPEAAAGSGAEAA